jgi:hypothetical protein
MFWFMYVFLYIKHRTIISALKYEANWVLSSQKIICKTAVPLGCCSFHLTDEIYQIPLFPLL